MNTVDFVIEHSDIFEAISAIPGTVTKPFSQARDEEVMDNLRKQLEAMCIKEYHYLI